MLQDEALVEEELIPVFEDLVQDTEAVQIGIVKHIAAFLTTLPALCRVSYLPILHEILHTVSPFNWRLRQHLAVQLPELVALPPKVDVFRTLYPTIMTLLQDPVASVRCDTFQGVTSLLTALLEVVDDAQGIYASEQRGASSDNLCVAIEAINAFITAEKFQMRQLWMELCPQLLRDLPRALFERHFLPGVLVLTLDTVFNVRLAVSNFLVGWYPDNVAPWEHHYQHDHAHDSSPAVSSSSRRGSLDASSATAEASPWKWLLCRADIKQCVARLASDDPDICRNVSMLKGLYPDLVFTSLSCRGRKMPPGGNVPIMVDATPISSISASAFDNLEESAAQAVEALMLVERLRSSSLSSRGGSGSLEHMQTEEQMPLASYLPKMQQQLEDDDDNAGRGDLSYGAQELEYDRASLLGIEGIVADELDIIDGLKYPLNRHNSSSVDATPPISALEDGEPTQLLSPGPEKT
jgi:hypothetical protein